jgi:sugar phosphate isomerase/epimerase
MKKDIIKKVQVNLPLRMIEDYMDKYLEAGLNPEFGIDSTVLDSVSQEKLESISEKFKNKKLSVTAHGPFFDLNPVSTDVKIKEISRKRIYDAVNYAEILNASSIVIHPGYDYRRHDFLRDEWVEKSCEFYYELASFAFDKNITVLLENVYERTPEEILPLLEAVNKKKGGFCFDTGHHFAFGTDRLESWLEKTGKFIREIHLHDNDGKNDLHLPPGKGGINFAPLINFLNVNKGRITITLEPHREEDLFPCFDWLEKNNVF